MHDVIVVGGGIAGLINAILLSREGFDVLLIEKKSYPFHRVCGEYISNEVKPFLVRNGLYPQAYGPTQISNFKLTSINGKQARIPLGMGGFGISRYAFDEYLFHQAESAGVAVLQKQSVSEIDFVGNEFKVVANHQSYSSKLVIGAFGKRSNLDRDRKFLKNRSPYIGTKYHIKTDLPANEIALHNFKDGYCGISQVENETFNLCYLSHRENLRKHGSIQEMESQVLRKNPFLNNIWLNSEFLFDKPEVINEITFEKKEPVFNHILMSGDTAGMIAPLCGNGMAMAIRSVHLLTNLIIKHWDQGTFNRSRLEHEYATKWNKNFAARLWVGRNLQSLFGANWSSNLAVRLVNNKLMGQAIVSLTHGRTF